MAEQQKERRKERELSTPLGETSGRVLWQKDFLAQESLVGRYQAEDHDGYFRNGESNPGLQGENLLS